MKKTRILSVLLLSTIALTALSPISANAAWKQNSTGWWFTEGSSYATGWRQISGAWYYFDNSGYMKTGWVRDNGAWYYLDKSGAMKTGWISDNGDWYYLDKSGAMKTGWVNDNGSWYFLKSDGVMASDEFVVDNGKEYYVSKSGMMKTGWSEIGGETYFFLESGEAVSGLCFVKNEIYYFENSSNRLMKNFKSELLSTDGNGLVIESHLDEVKGLILNDDAEYFAELRKKYGDSYLELVDFSSFEQILDEEYKSYTNGVNEDCLVYLASVPENGEIKYVKVYLIGIKSGVLFYNENL